MTHLRAIGRQPHASEALGLVGAASEARSEPQASEVLGLVRRAKSSG